MPELEIHYRNPAGLKPSPKNARSHSRKQIEQIAQSIRSFGFNNPILLDGADDVIAGHGRVAAAIELGIAAVPTVRLDHLSPAQKRAYAIADNRLAELAAWDENLLAVELQGLMAIDLDFDITDIGFEMPAIDLLLAGASVSQETDPSDDLGDLDHIPSIARQGDLWGLGDHMVFCGDALAPESYRVLLGREKAEMVFTDPPYNVPINGHVSGLGRAKHSEFLMASGEMSREEFADFLRNAMRLAAHASMDGAIHFICMDWRHLADLFAATADIYSEVKNVCIWVKTNGGMGSLYRSQYEMVGVFKVGRGPHINNVELGRHGRSRTNVWTYPGMNSFQKARESMLEMHPTLKPIALVRDAIYDCSSRGGIILDPFGGAGTTLLAAEQSGRVARLMELDPRYVDVTLQRFARATGVAPVNLWTGEVMDLARCGSPNQPTDRQRIVGG